MGSPPPTRFHLVGQLTIFSPDAIWATFSLLNKSIWEGIPEGSPFLLSIVQINPPWNSGTIFTSKKGQNLFGQGVPPIWTMLKRKVFFWDPFPYRQRISTPMLTDLNDDQFLAATVFPPPLPKQCDTDVFWTHVTIAPDAIICI